MIRVEGLTKSFGATQALRELTFEVGKAQVMGFVGPNGAGKTTTMRILAGLVPPTSGEVTVEGIDVSRHPEQVRERVGWMPDFFGVYEHLTAGEYLGFYASCHRLPRRRVEGTVANLLELVRLSDKRRAPVDTLSRGMKQRLCLARALVHDPGVLLLDEPASGLDPRARAEMRDLVGELRAMGKTIVLSSHILPELAEMCTTFGIIDLGRMVASGPLDELLGGAGRRRARVTVRADAGRAAPAARALPGVAEVSTHGDVLLVHYEVDHGDAAAAASRLLAGLLGAGVEVVSFVPEHTDLEDVFLRVTGEELVG